MKTEDLIETLAANLEPVAPLWRPAARAVVWLAGAGLYVALLTLAMAQSGAMTVGVGPFLIASQLGAVATSLLAARAAFASVVPGRAKGVLVWPVIAAVVWLGALVAGAFARPEPDPVLGADSEWVCVGVILLGGAPLLAVLVAMLRRGAPLRPSTSAALAAVAVGALANVGACFSRPHTDDAVTLVWHGGAILALTLLCIAAAPRVLTWRASAPR
jgi:hypothetical protein